MIGLCPVLSQCTCIIILGKSNSRSSTPEIPEKKEEKEYQDPGRFLGDTLDIESEDDTMDNIVLLQAEKVKSAIRCLANALCQVAEAVDSRHLKRPLGE